MIIAIDGPAASGKGTLGKRLAAHYRLRHLDTGLIYRAVALTLLDRGEPLDDVPAAVGGARIARSRPVRRGRASRPTRSARPPPGSRSIPEVREALLAFQRDFGRTPPGAVLDGRDIGTVIFPDADVKIFVTATPEVRARRRALELRAAGGRSKRPRCWPTSTAATSATWQRTTAPLKPAPDAHLLDTTHLDIDAAFRAAVDIVEAVRTGREHGRPRSRHGG